jgi:hypothetical protein
MIFEHQLTSPFWAGHAGEKMQVVGDTPYIR